MKPEIAVLLLTHRWDRFVELKFERLRDEIGDAAEVILLLQASPDTDRALAERPLAEGAAWLFDPDELPRRLGYPYLRGRSIVPGSTHFPVLAFARERAPDFCLTLEYDVEFSGHWGTLLATLTDAEPDFAAFHFRSFADDPAWHWWRTCRPAPGDLGWAADKRNLRRSFNPLYGLSRRALELLHAAHRGGWRGHYELLLATVLAQRGCRMLDLAERGLCGGREQNARAGMAPDSLSTFRWQPEVTVAEFQARNRGATLFHPVKDGWLFDGRRVVDLEPGAAGNRRG